MPKKQTNSQIYYYRKQTTHENILGVEKLSRETKPLKSYRSDNPVDNFLDLNNTPSQNKPKLTHKKPNIS
jgi:hypothetical protein